MCLYTKPARVVTGRTAFTKPFISRLWHNPEIDLDNRAVRQAGFDGEGDVIGRCIGIANALKRDASSSPYNVQCAVSDTRRRLHLAVMLLEFFNCLVFEELNCIWLLRAVRCKARLILDQKSSGLVDVVEIELHCLLLG